LRPAGLSVKESDSMTKRKSWATCLLPLLLLTATAACSVTSGQETPGEYIDSATISNKVRAKLASEAGMDVFSQVKVTTVEDRVQLSGFVRKPDDKVQAEQIAWSVEGVRGVENDIVVQP
jgi:hyperosmotically inducible protein